MTSTKSSNVKHRLDALGLVEGEEYSLLLDIQQQWKGARGTKYTKVYMLTPDAFKTCLMRARRYPNQTTDPQVYSKYYLLLEKTHKLYTDYEKQLLAKQLEQNKQALEQNKQILEQKDQALEQNKQILEQKDKLVLRLNEMLVDKTELPKTQIVYIATSENYANQNRFKVGGVESLDKLAPRLSSYNGRSASGDEFYYAEWYTVHNYRDIEIRLKNLLGRFRDKASKEIYILHYTKLEYILSYIITHYNDETDHVNEHLADFISSLDTHNLRPVVPPNKHLKKITIADAGRPDVEITGNSFEEIENKLRQYFESLDADTDSVTSKSVFDKIGVKVKRLELFAVAQRIGKQVRPDVKVKRR